MIMDKREKELKNKKVPLVNVLQSNSQIKKETQERYDVMKRKKPSLFDD